MSALLLKRGLLALCLSMCVQPWLPVDLARAEPVPEQRGGAQSVGEDSSIKDEDACPLLLALPPGDSTMGFADERAYRAVSAEARRQQTACIAERRALRLEARRRTQLAGRTSRRLGVTLGYDGALLVQGGPENGRFRSPSVLLGLLFRRHYHPRVGLHVLLAPALGPGRFGAGNFETTGTKAKRVGPSFTAVGEVGVLIGPGDWVYFMLAAQSRLVVQPEHEVEFVFEHSSGQDVVSVRWPSPMLCLGVRAGFGLMLGPRHEYFVEFGGGGGAVLAQDAAYITVGLRVGRAFDL